MHVGIVVAVTAVILTLAALAAVELVPTADDRAEAEVSPRVSERPPGKVLEAGERHVTFGAHVSATQACATCHVDDGAADVAACRSCHGDVCGKKARSVGDCLECHKTGSATKWEAAR